MRAHSIFIPVPLAHFAHRWAKISEIYILFLSRWKSTSGSHLVLQFNSILLCIYGIILFFNPWELGIVSDLGYCDVNSATMNIGEHIYFHINSEEILGYILNSGKLVNMEVIFLIFETFKTIFYRNWIKWRLATVMDKVSFLSISLSELIVSILFDVCQSHILIPISRSWNYLCSKFPSTSTEVFFPCLCYSIWNTYFEPKFRKWNR